MQITFRSRGAFRMAIGSPPAIANGDPATGLRLRDHERHRAAVAAEPPQPGV